MLVLLVRVSCTAAQTLATPAGELQIFPKDNPWNTDVSNLPVHPKSDAFVRSIGSDKRLKPDFGTQWQGRPMGIPFNVVSGSAKKIAIAFQYADESDKGPYPVPENPLIEGGPDAPLDSDGHILMIDFDHKILYELFQAVRRNGQWTAGSGAIWDLTKNQIRPARWTSADAAGLAIFPGLARYDEVVEKGEIKHALRFTASKTQRGYVAPASHWASQSRDPALPPMGLRVRLRKDFDDSQAPKNVKVILAAMKKYGLILADNGSDWFISGAPDPRWNDEELHWLRRIKGSDMQAVDTGPIVTDRQ